MLSLLSGLIDSWLPTPPDPRRVGWLGEWRYAHRGLHGPGVVENSRTAFDYAIRAGVGIECDIQRSADTRAMVFHDWDLDRLTNAEGVVESKSAAELGAITLTGSEDRIETLEALFEQIGGKVPLLIEIKSKRDKRIGATCLAVRRAIEGYTGKLAVMSFDPRVSRWFARNAPLVVRGLVVTEEGKKGLRGKWERFLAMRHAEPEFLAYDIRDLPSGFAAGHRKRGFPVLTWTVKSPELAARASEHADAPIAEGEGLT